MNSDIQFTLLPSTSPIAAHLEDLSRRLISHINERDWTHPDWHAYITPNFHVYAPEAFLEQLSSPTTSTREQYISSYRDFVEANPHYEIDVERVDVQIHKGQDMAKTWIVFVVGGHPVNVRKESVSIIHWLRREGDWVAVKQTGIRGVPGF